MPLKRSCMPLMRFAAPDDLDVIEHMYDLIHDQEESGVVTIGWERGVYPTRQTATDALARGDLYVEEVAGEIVACAIINTVQPDGYEQAAWTQQAEDNDVLILHTLVVDPRRTRNGYGRAFVEFYEELARKDGCISVRMDTNARNTRARAMYARMGYTEVSIVPVTFNGIENVDLVCLEKLL